MNKTPFFSVVIPTLNEELSLPKLLKDLSDQTYQDFEVIHVDGSSEDQTVKLAEKFTKKLRLKSFVVKKRNVSYQRNFGGKKTRGEWIIFMDADNRISSDFFDGIRYYIAKNKPFDLFTCWINPDKNNPSTKAIANAINIGIELNDKIKKPIAFGALIGMKKKVLQKIQFDEDQKVVEDTLFVKTAVKQGFTFKVIKEPRYVYSLRRMRKEGTMKMTLIAATLFIKHLQGKDFTESDYGYEMKGGKYYDQTKPSLLKNLQLFIHTASKKQLDQAKKILESIREID